eukprot:g17822.t1
MGNVGVSRFGKACARRKTEEEIRAEIRDQILYEIQEKEKADREAAAARRREAAEKAAQHAKDKKEAEEVSKAAAEQARIEADNKLREDLRMKDIIGEYLIPHVQTMQNFDLRLQDVKHDAGDLERMKVRVDALSNWADSSSQLQHEEMLKDLGHQERKLVEKIENNFYELDTKLSNIEGQTGQLDDAVALLIAALGDTQMIKDLPDGDVAAALAALGIKFTVSRAELDANIVQASDYATELRTDLNIVREIATHHQDLFEQLKVKIDDDRNELNATLDTERMIALENQEELRKSLSSVVGAVKELEDRVYFLENQDDEICSECGSVDQSTSHKKKSGPHLESVPEIRSSAAAADPVRSLAEQIAKGEVIPRTKHDERIDMIDWSQLRIIEPRITETSKTTKWGDLYIATLTKPPLRQDFAWRVWKESVWHWAVSLRLVGASFTKMGQQVIAQSFRRNPTTGEIFEGEHSVATAAGQSRDLVEIMSALDMHFCPHTRTVQSALESDVHLIKRPDMQSPMLFLHLLGIIYRREVEINGSTNVRTEKAKVDRALKALYLQKPTEQLIRSSISRATVHQPYTYQMLQSEVDSLSITDYKRYQPNAAGVDVHFPKQREEVDFMQKLLEQIGERLSVDSLGQHAMTNSYFHQTARNISGRGGNSAGTGLFTFAGGQPDQGVDTPSSTTSQQNLQSALQSFLQQAAAGSGGKSGISLITPGGTQAPNNYSADGETKKDSNGKEFWAPAKLSAEEQAKRIEASNRFKLKKEPNANWCKFGEFCSDVLTTGKCQGKHTKKEFWRMITQLERNFPEKAKQLAKERADKKAKEINNKNK